MTEQTETPESELSQDKQIENLLSDEFETGEAENPVKPVEDESTLPQEETPTEDDKSEEEANQEEAEEATTWASALGLSDDQIVLDDDGNFKSVITKVEGKTQEVDLKELVKGYQIDSYNKLKTEALQAERQRFEQMANQQAQVLQQRVQEASAYVNNLEEQIVGEFQSIDWEALRGADPAEYAARRQDYALKYSQIKQQKDNIQQAQYQEQQQQRANAEKSRFMYLQNEAQQALKEKPEWNDPKVRVQAMSEMAEVIKTYGFNEQEIAALSDHRYINMVDDLRAYHAIKKEGKPKLEKKVPKFVKPLASKPRNTKGKKLDKLYKKAADSGSVKLKDAAIEQLLLNS